MSQVRELMDAYPRIYFACHTRHVRDADSGVELTSHQASILDHLDEKEPLSLKALAAHMGVTPATMSIHVNRLSGKGLIRRTRNPSDNRGVELRLTQQGAALRDAKSVLDADRVAALLAELSEEERRKALDGLVLLAEAAGRSMVRRSGARPARLHSRTG